MREARHEIMTRMWGALFISGGVIVLIVLLLAGMIAFGGGDAPPPLASISRPFHDVDFRDLPAIDTTPARRGTPIAFRVYRGTSGEPGREGVVIAIHGSSATSTSLHPLAKAISAAGWTVYVPDIRGHGATGRRGDIDDAGQLDDDLADLVALIRTRHKTARLVLLGFSSGGGFALHAAATPLGREFERVILISPMLGYRAPTARPGAEAWAKAFLPRIVALSILGRLGIHRFDNLPTLAFAIEPENAKILTSTYSFRLMTAFGTNDYAADLRKASAPVSVIVGGADELFFAERYTETVKAVRPDASVAIVPGVGHITMTLDARALAAIVATLREAD
jgi:alpha-beta hydrolase superfamily lysophospholipase